VFLALRVLFTAVALGTIMMRRPSTLPVTGGEHLLSDGRA
jgi:hypothetical protein